MRYVTVCEDQGERKVKGIDHKVAVYKMLPGLAWQINDETKEHHVVEIKAAEKAVYTYSLRWIDGRTCAIFTGPDGRDYCQPITEDPRAKERRVGSIRAPCKKFRKPRREASGVAGAINPENIGPEPKETREERAERVEARTSYVRAKPRKALELL